MYPGTDAGIWIGVVEQLGGGGDWLVPLCLFQILLYDIPFVPVRLQRILSNA